MNATVAMPKQEMVSLGSLKLSGYNPRSMPDEEMQSLISSISQFGFVQPVVARRSDGLVIGGHQRIDAFRRLLASEGWKPDVIDRFQVPVIFLDGIGDEQAKMLNLALNKISGRWDNDKLAPLLESLVQGNPDPAKLAVTGFSSEEIAGIIELWKVPPLEPADSTVDVAEGLAAQARRFSFEVATDAESKACADALKQFGMTGPGNASEAFVRVCKAAVAQADTKKRRKQK